MDKYAWAHMSLAQLKIQKYFCLTQSYTMEIHHLNYSWVFLKTLSALNIVLEGVYLYSKNVLTYITFILINVWENIE